MNRECCTDHLPHLGPGMKQPVCHVVGWTRSSQCQDRLPSGMCGWCQLPSVLVMVFSLLPHLHTDVTNVTESDHSCTLWFSESEPLTLLLREEDPLDRMRGKPVAPDCGIGSLPINTTTFLSLRSVENNGFIQSKSIVLHFFILKPGKCSHHGFLVHTVCKNSFVETNYIDIWLQVFSCG